MALENRPSVVSSSREQNSVDDSEIDYTWRGTTLYHLYLPSFKDSNNDGLGDLGGVREKLSYLKELGVEGILMPPMYPSLQIETGYAVSDYMSVDKRYGSLQECESFIQEAHDSGMKVIFDLVMNHTSHEHPWFVESSSSKSNPKSDWYIWRDPKEDGSPPSNLVANFGGIAWEYSPERKQYYYHTFLKEQPELNYQNPEVVEAMKDVVRFWFGKGVDGMRLDSLPFVGKDPELQDEEVNENYQPGRDHPFQRLNHKNIWYQEGMLTVLKELSDIATGEFENKFIISEAYPPKTVDQSWIERIYKTAPDDNHAILNSGTISVPWEAAAFQEFVTAYYERLGSHIPMWILDSHDEYSRLVNRIGESQARVAAMWQLTVPSSMPVIYYGDEVGMKSWPVRPNTPTNVFYWVDPTSTRTKEAVRLPLPWNDQEYGGFSLSEPWLPLPTDYKENNVESNLSNDKSMYHLYKKLLEHRRSSEAIRTGSYHLLDSQNEQVYAYECRSETEKEVVLLNFSSDVQEISLPYEKMTPLLSSHLIERQGSEERETFQLLPDEGVIFSVEGSLDKSVVQQ